MSRIARCFKSPHAMAPYHRAADALRGRAWTAEQAAELKALIDQGTMGGPR